VYFFICKMALSGLWSQKWSQRSYSRTMVELTHGLIPSYTRVNVRSYTQELCDRSKFITERYDVLIGETPATWIMHGEIECIPRERSGYVIRTSYDVGRLYAAETPDTCVLYPNMTLCMQYRMNFFEIIVLDPLSRVDRDCQSRLSMYHRKTKSIPIPYGQKHDIAQQKSKKAS